MRTTIALVGICWLLLTTSASGQGIDVSLADEEVDSGGPNPISWVLSPSIVLSFSEEQIESSGARFPTDVMRQSIAAGVVRVRSTDSNVNVRGYSDISSSSQGVMYLVDGRQVYNSFYGNTLSAGIGLNFYFNPRIEMLVGPATAFYGPNSMHGVVNIITPSPLDYTKEDLEDLSSITTAVGSYGSVEAAYTNIRRTETSGFKTTAVFDDMGQFEDSHGNAKDRQFVEFRLERDLDDVRLGLTGGLTQYKTDALLPSIAILDPVTKVMVGSLDQASLDTKLAESFLKANYTRGSLQMEATWTVVRADVQPTRTYTPFQLDHEVVDLDARTSVDLLGGDHETTIGAGTRIATFDTDFQNSPSGRHTASLLWVYFHDEYQWTEQIRLTGGLRADLHSTAGTIISPRLAAVWEYEKGKSVRASFGMGFRTPSLRELWLAMPITLTGGAPGNIIGNRHLDPERITSFELSYFAKVTPDTIVRVDTYYNFIDDLVEFVLVGPTPDFSFDNKQEEEARGFEAQIETQYNDRLAFFAGYAYAYRRARHSPKDTIHFSPQHRATAGIKIHKVSRDGRGLSAMIWSEYADETKWPLVVGVDQRVDPYVHVHAGVTCHFHVRGKKARAFLRCWNLLNDTHREHPEGDRYGSIISVGMSFEW